MNYCLMITCSSLLDLMNNHLGWSDYRIAKELGAGSGLVSRWRLGKSIMSDKYAVKVAEILGFPPEWLLLQLHAEANLTKPYGSKLAAMVESEPVPESVEKVLGQQTLPLPFTGSKGH